jgi:hypothetical protein
VEEMVKGIDEPNQVAGNQLGIVPLRVGSPGAVGVKGYPGTSPRPVQARKVDLQPRLVDDDHPRRYRQEPLLSTATLKGMLMSLPDNTVWGKPSQFRLLSGDKNAVVGGAGPLFKPFLRVEYLAEWEPISGSAQGFGFGLDFRVKVVGSFHYLSPGKVCRIKLSK